MLIWDGVKIYVFCCFFRSPIIQHVTTSAGFETGLLYANHRLGIISFFRWLLPLLLWPMRRARGCWYHTDNVPISENESSGCKSWWQCLVELWERLRNMSDLTLVTRTFKICPVGLWICMNENNATGKVPRNCAVITWLMYSTELFKSILLYIVYLFNRNSEMNGEKTVGRWMFHWFPSVG